MQTKTLFCMRLIVYSTNFDIVDKSNDWSKVWNNYNFALFLKEVPKSELIWYYIVK